MVDRARLRALLDQLGEETRQLHRLAGYEPEQLLGDPYRVAAVKYRFVVAIEICIDVGQHVIASEGLRAPADFADVFAVLGATGFISQDSVATLQAMARFRNLLVHGYLRVDDQRVIQILRTRLADFDFQATRARPTTSPSNAGDPPLGYHAVHLAALRALGEPGEVTFACWDQQLSRAAHEFGYRAGGVVGAELPSLRRVDR
jgi:uncharacterized protein YutE (UPF0331/DUF86 family)